MGRPGGRSAFWKWSATIAAIAAALALVAGGETWLWRVAHVLSRGPAAIDAETLEFLERLSAALSSFRDAQATPPMTFGDRPGSQDVAAPGEDAR